MHIGHDNKRYPYHMNNQVPEVVKEKDLGVVFTDSIKLSGQCMAAYKKASLVLGMIGRTITYKSKMVLLSFYKTLVRPHLEY